MSSTTVNSLSGTLQSVGKAILRECTRKMLRILVLLVTDHEL